jgi:hypothetical protein
MLTSGYFHRKALLSTKSELYRNPSPQCHDTYSVRSMFGLCLANFVACRVVLPWCVVQYLAAAGHLVAVLGALLWTAHRESRGKALLNKITQPTLVYDSKADDSRYTIHHCLARHARLHAC